MIKIVNEKNTLLKISCGEINSRIVSSGTLRGVIVYDKQNMLDKNVDLSIEVSRYVGTRTLYGMLHILFEKKQPISFEEIHSEIEKILITDDLVKNWTYPLIQPRLLEEAKNRGYL